MSEDERWGGLVTFSSLGSITHTLIVTHRGHETLLTGASYPHHEGPGQLEPQMHLAMNIRYL
jgi:hypothetical protein